MSRPRVAVSACLLGCHCRYDGRAREDARVLALAGTVQFVPVCPEALAGLPIPRSPMEWKAAPDGTADEAAGARLVDAEGRDLTRQVATACEQLAAMLAALDVGAAICKERSPSCGVHQVHLDGRLAPGAGALTRRLQAREIIVVSEEEVAALPLP